jgi:sugar lactone lactonase YvrE
VHNFKLKAFDETGELLADIPVPGRPAGTGFGPRGDLMVATALDRKIWVVTGVRLSEFANLSKLTTGLLNDMVVDARGRIYVGDTGYNLGANEARRAGKLLLVDKRGEARVVDDEVMFPNGLVITPDGCTLLVAETFANRISAFDILDNGDLTRRRLFADLPGTPDGICLDREMGLWVALLEAHAFIRIDARGQETHRLDVAPDNALSCMIGGAKRETLYLCHTQAGAARRGSVTLVKAPFAGAGLP